MNAAKRWPGSGDVEMRAATSSDAKRVLKKRSKARSPECTVTMSNGGRSEFSYVLKSTRGVPWKRILIRR